MMFHVYIYPYNNAICLKSRVATTRREKGGAAYFFSTFRGGAADFFSTFEGGRWFLLAFFQKVARPPHSYLMNGPLIKYW